MNVEEAIAEERLLPVFGSSAPYYAQKFAGIAQRANIAHRSIEDQWPIVRKGALRPSFNLLGLIFGVPWGLYHRLPEAKIMAALLVAYGMVTTFTGIEFALGPSLAYGLSGIFGIMGNSWLLRRYLAQCRSTSDSELVAFNMRPSWALAAIPIALSVGGVVGLSAIEGTPLAPQFTGTVEMPTWIRSALSPESSEAAPSSAEVTPTSDTLASSKTQDEWAEDVTRALEEAGQSGDWQPPQGFEKMTTNSGLSYGLLMSENYSCGWSALVCGKFQVVSAQDCDRLTATYKVFDGNHRHLATDEHTVESVAMNDVVMMKFDLYESAAAAFEVVGLSCDGV